MGGRCIASLKSGKYLALLLFLGAIGVSWEFETATFDWDNEATYSLFQPPNASSPFVQSVQLEFRTSYGHGYLAKLSNENGEQFWIRIENMNELKVTTLTLVTGINGSSHVWHFMKISAPSVASGEWHHLTVQVESGGRLEFDGEPLDDRLPNNFTVRFPYNDTAEFEIGGSYRGCLSNVSIDEVVPVPLHSRSELINQNKFLKPIDTSLLPKTGPGCRQSPCVCKPNGVCIYRQWDRLDRCNCTRGYEGRYCNSEWNTCTNLETGPPCLNGGFCLNVRGIDKYICECPSGFVGSTCQNKDLCLPQNPCQNGGSCELLGDRNNNESIHYNCRCVHGFIGQNCSEAISYSWLIGLSVSLIILFLSGLIGVAVFVCLKDRRRRMNADTQCDRANLETCETFHGY